MENDGEFNGLSDNKKMVTITVITFMIYNDIDRICSDTKCNDNSNISIDNNSDTDDNVLHYIYIM